MTAFTVSLVEWLCRLLDPDERDAVCGDLAEAGATTRQTLVEIAGLLIRRQASIWREPQPWLALVGVVAPLGFLLSLISRSEAKFGAIYGWTYTQAWTWQYLQNPGARADLLYYAGAFVIGSLAMFCWAWAAGYVVGLLSGRGLWLTAVLFVLMLFAGTMGSSTSADGRFNAVVFSQFGYRVLFPLILRIALVLLPALDGMLRARRRPIALRGALLWMAAIGSLTWLAAGQVEGAATFGWFTISSRFAFVRVFARGHQVWPWPMHLLPLVMAWPILYIVVHSFRSHSATGRWQQPLPSGGQ